MIRQVHHNAAWTFFHGPRSVHASGKTFIGYGGRTALWCSSFDHTSGKFGRKLLMSTSTNDHDVVAVGLRKDGCVICAYSRHNDDYMRVRVGSTPHDVTSLGDELIVATGTCTYPHLFHLTAEGSVEHGRWYLFYREWSLNGRGGRVFVYSDDGGATWSDQQTFVWREGHRP